MDTRAIAKEYLLRHWAGVMEDRLASGESVKAYCKMSEICENVYYYWQRKLREAECEGRLPVSPKNDVQSLTPHGWAICKESEPPSPRGTVKIEIGKCRVVAEAGISAEQLEKVCRVLVKLC